MAATTDTTSNPVLMGTSGADTLDLTKPGTVKALGGDDTINLTNPSDSLGADPYWIDGGTGLDTLHIFGEPFDWNTYRFSQIKGVKSLVFHSFWETNVLAYFPLTIAATVTGRVVAHMPGQMTGDIGGDQVWVRVSGGMGGASEIDLPHVTFVNWSPEETGSRYQLGDSVRLEAADDQDYTFRASSFISAQGVVQRLLGRSGNDTLIGSSGQDILIDWGGTTHIAANAGNDRIILGATDGVELPNPVVMDGVINGGKGSDTLQVKDAVEFHGSMVSIEAIELGVRDWAFQYSSPGELHLSGDAATRLPSHLVLNGDGTLYISGASTLNASAFVIELDDELLRSHLTVDITGTAGDDRLIGSNASGIINYETGGDNFHATLGDDFINGMDGLDTIIFDDSSFTSGVSFNLARLGAQTIATGSTLAIRNVENATGTSFADKLRGNANFNILHGGDGDDMIWGGGLDTLNGDGGNDTLRGNGLDTLHGDDGDDILWGSGGDTLFGDAGNDRLISGSGGNHMNGGAGADTFRFKALPPSQNSYNSIDWNKSDGDRIQFSKAGFTGFATTGALDDAAFYGAEGAKTAHDADDRVIFNSTTGDIYYDADGTGSAATAVLVARIDFGLPKDLSASDIFIVA